MSVLDLSMVRNKIKKVPAIAGVHPVGSQILLELLTEQEMANTSILVADGVEMGLTPQAYVLELGPQFPETVGIKPGQRVFVQGRGVPVPNYDNKERVKMLVEYSMIKGIITEHVEETAK